MKRLLAAALVALPFAAFAATDDNLLTNGSFESNVLRNGSWSIFGTIDGWTVGSKGVEVRNNVSGTALDGRNFAAADLKLLSVMANFAAVAIENAHLVARLDKKPAGK